MPSNVDGAALHHQHQHQHQHQPSTSVTRPAPSHSQNMNMNIPATRGRLSQVSAAMGTTSDAEHTTSVPASDSSAALAPRIAVAEKQCNELRDLRVRMLEEKAARADAERAKALAQLKQIKEDFRYNVKLVEERDAELARWETNGAALRQQLDASRAALEEANAALLEAQSDARTSTSRLAEAEQYYQRRLGELRTALDDSRFTASENALKAREEIEKERRTCARKVQASADELSAVRTEMAQNHDEVVRKMQMQHAAEMDALTADRDRAFRRAETAEAAEKKASEESAEAAARCSEAEKNERDLERQLAQVTFERDNAQRETANAQASFSRKRQEADDARSMEVASFQARLGEEAAKVASMEAALEQARLEVASNAKAEKERHLVAQTHLLGQVDDLHKQLRKAAEDAERRVADVRAELRNSDEARAKAEAAAEAASDGAEHAVRMAKATAVQGVREVEERVWARDEEIRSLKAKLERMKETIAQRRNDLVACERKLEESDQERAALRARLQASGVSRKVSDGDGSVDVPGGGAPVSAAHALDGQSRQEAIAAPTASGSMGTQPRYGNNNNNNRNSANAAEDAPMQNVNYHHTAAPGTHETATGTVSAAQTPRHLVYSREPNTSSVRYPESAAASDSQQTTTHPQAGHARAAPEPSTSGHPQVILSNPQHTGSVSGAVPPAVGGGTAPVPPQTYYTHHTGFVSGAAIPSAVGGAAAMPHQTIIPNAGASTRHPDSQARIPAEAPSSFAGQTAHYPAHRAPNQPGVSPLTLPSDHRTPDRGNISDSSPLQSPGDFTVPSLRSSFEMSPVPPAPAPSGGASAYQTKQQKLLQEENEKLRESVAMMRAEMERLINVGNIQSEATPSPAVNEQTPPPQPTNATLDAMAQLNLIKTELRQLRSQHTLGRTSSGASPADAATDGGTSTVGDSGPRSARPAETPAAPAAPAPAVATHAPASYAPADADMITPHSQAARPAAWAMPDDTHVAYAGGLPTESPNHAAAAHLRHELNQMHTNNRHVSAERDRLLAANNRLRAELTGVFQAAATGSGEAAALHNNISNATSADHRAAASAADDARKHRTDRLVKGLATIYKSPLKEPPTTTEEELTLEGHGTAPEPRVPSRPLSASARGTASQREKLAAIARKRVQEQELKAGRGPVDYNALRKSQEAAKA